MLELIGLSNSGVYKTMSSEKIMDGRMPLPPAAARGKLYRQTMKALAMAGLVLVMANLLMTGMHTFGLVHALTSMVIYAAVCAIIVPRILNFHPHPVFGWPNAVTLARIVLTTLIAGYTAEISRWALPPSLALAWTFTLMAGLAVLLDGLDGWLARKVGPRSAFGARFDMECDALLILVLCILAAVLGKVGVWIILIGVLRYLFVAASWLWPWMQRTLPGSERRQVICVVQSISLVVLVAPPVQAGLASGIGAGALLLLCLSFAIDIAWLYRRRDSAEAVNS